MPRRAQSEKPTGVQPKQVCHHTSILTEPSFQAAKAGYVQPSASQRANAQGVKVGELSEDPYTFPAPLVLPDDDIALDPQYPAQSFQSWIKDRDRNGVTAERRTIYITGPPYFDRDVGFAQPWAFPSTVTDRFLPSFQRVLDYVQAFYYPLPVVWVPPVLKFVSWSSSDTAVLKAGLPNQKDQEPVRIGLQSPQEVVGIRVRRGPLDDFNWQLNLDDLLDVAISMLPSDAYAMLMIVNQDLYEDDDDDFVCGRAYGGSRVAVVSTARYNPTLDVTMDLNLDHVWPLSHCKEFVDSLRTRTRKRKIDEDVNASLDNNNSNTPLMKAVSATLELRLQREEKAYACWIGRVCRTASHELGHCFGIDHCMYYACCMQGSASIKEDHRQPPYLCPVDLTKVLKATGASEKTHLKTMLDFCQKHQDTNLFVAYAAWLEGRLEDLG